MQYFHRLSVCTVVPHVEPHSRCRDARTRRCVRRSTVWPPVGLHALRVCFVACQETGVQRQEGEMTSSHVFCTCMSVLRLLLSTSASVHCVCVALSEILLVVAMCLLLYTMAR